MAAPPTNRRRPLVVLALGLLVAYGVGSSAHGQLCVQYTGGLYQEDFDSLSATGTSNTAATVPMGFAFVEAGTGSQITYAADDGNGSTGSTYSYGTAGNGERAFGELTSSTVQSTLGMCVVNSVGVPISSFKVGYRGEEWRLGVADATVDRLDFQYSLNATTLNNGTWTDVDTLDFTTPANAGVGAKDGNSASNRVTFAPVTITPPSSIPSNAVFFLRWVPSNIAGDNDGLAIDDFNFFGNVNCVVDVDGNGAIDPLTDGLVMLRAMFGFTGGAVTTGAIGPMAKRTTWTQIRAYLNSYCGTNFAE